MSEHDDPDGPVEPIELGPIANGEYLPEPPTEIRREARRRLWRLAGDTAPRLGLSRREFLVSSAGTAAALFVLASCSNESSKANGGAPGGTFSVPKSSTTDPDEAREVLGGDEFIFDVQTHLLDFDLADGRRVADWGRNFPYAECGDDDWRDCFDTDHWFRELFVRSDTTMAVISAVPILADPNPLSIDVMERARTGVRSVCGDANRVFLHGQVNPNLGDLEGELDHMRDIATAHPIGAWKVYTHVPSGRGWYLDDHDADSVLCGQAFLDVVREVGPKIVCVHKGFGGNSAHSSPIDIGPAAKANPDIAFVVYHSGYDGPNEGPYDESADAPAGVDRLLASIDAAGIEPHANVYAELGSTWFNVMRDPTRAAHVIGKLVQRLGDDRVLWGTDSIWYGSPQGQIEAFRTFSISDEFQDTYGYPALTDDAKRNIFGRNAAALYGVEDPAITKCQATDEAIATLRAMLPPPKAYGPRTIAQAKTLMREHGLAV